MATNYTTNYDLCQWEPTDPVQRVEFNQDNAKVDAALKALSDQVVQKANQSAVNTLVTAVNQKANQTDLTAALNSIIQAEELGVSIARQLRIQGDMQRNKRFTLAEKLANEASVKIIIPVVLFILPAVFIILLGPLVLYTARLFR